VTRVPPFARLAAGVVLPLALVLLACGTRVSLGELDQPTLPLTDETSEAGVAPPAVTLDAAADAAAEIAPDATSAADASPDAPVVFDGGPDWTPCGGKVCGASCSLCPPTDPGCIEAAVLKYCAADGVCGISSPTCP